MPKLSVKLSGYDVLKQDDGWRGNGVDLYLGYIFNSRDIKRGDTTGVAGGLRNNNGTPQNQVWHPYEAAILSSVEIPVGTVATLAIRMFESDQSTDEVTQKFRQAQIPNLNDYALKADFKYESNKDLISNLLQNFGAFIWGLIQGGHVNTDDTYGYWTFSISAFEDRFEFTLGPAEAHVCRYNNVNAPGFSLVVSTGAGWKPLCTPVFEDNDNLIGVGLMAQAEA